MPLNSEKQREKTGSAVHGGIHYAEMEKMGLDPDNIIDFSVCTNPFMPPPGVREMMSNVRIDRYPDSYCTDLRKRLSLKTGVPIDNILVGSGTTELIRLVAAAFFGPGDRVMLLEPTYGDYEVAVRNAGARPIRYHAREGDNFSINVKTLEGSLRRRRPSAVVICNPNNPTGYYLDRQIIRMIMQATGNRLLVLDEAYAAFVEKKWDSLRLVSRKNVIVLRSMTKDYNIPGLRLGYAVARRKIIDAMRELLPPWNVNSIAQAAGAVLLEKEYDLQDSLRRVRESKRYLEDEFLRLGFRTIPSNANYFLVKVGNAGDFRLSLLKSGILVRDCTSFGLPEYIRVSARTRPECEKLIGAIGQLIERGEYRISAGNDKCI